MRETTREPSWFAVLADHPGAAPAFASGFPRQPVLVKYPSGRPWLLGVLGTDSVARVGSGARELLLIGQFSWSRNGLEAAARQYWRTGDLARLRAGIGAGSFDVVARDEDAVTVAGPAFGTRLFFRTVKDGHTIVATRSDVLATLHGRRFDEQALALRLVSALPHPLTERSVWDGVERVPPGTAVRIPRAADRPVKLPRWWHAQPADRGLADGAAEVLAELRAATRVRRQPGGRLSADLSGGVDSTSLCFLATEHGGSLITYTLYDSEAADDYRIACAAAADLPGTHSVRQHVRELPGEFAGLLAPRPVVDEPSELVLGANRLWETVRVLAACGARTHLTGAGGDNLTRPGRSYCYDLARSSPWHALRHIRGHRHTTRWGVREVVTALADRESYGDWLLGCPKRLRTASAQHVRPDFSWGLRPEIAPWVCGDAVREIERALTDAAWHAPLDPSRSRHVELQAHLAQAALVRSMDQVAGHQGVRWSAPYTDDRVIEAAMRVRPEERFGPWEFKPLFRAAFRSVVPAYVVDRTTKTVVSGDTHAAGIRSREVGIAALFEGSLLVQEGLVDPDVLRSELRRPSVRDVLAGQLPATLSLEIWLRGSRSAAVVPEAVTGPRRSMEPA
ncbi:asparagine synthase-related protein [Amycolatopsis sp. NPDC004378]